MSKLVRISDENVEWLKSMCKEGSFNDAILILKNQIETLNKENFLFKENFSVVNRNIMTMSEKLEQKINEINISLKNKSNPPNIPEKIIHKSPDDVVLPQELIDQLTMEYQKIGGNYETNLKMSLQAARQKIFDKQQKELTIKEI